MKIKVTCAAAAVLTCLVLANVNLNNEVKADTKPVNTVTKANISNAKTAAGFFKRLSLDQSLTKKQREDAKNAYSIVMNEGKFKGFYNQDVKLTWYHPEKQLGREGDATSLANMQKALLDLDDLVKIRKQYGLNLPKVSLTATAIAMMSSNYLLNHNFDHPINHPADGPFWKDEENIATGSRQVSLYMSEKEYIDKAITNNPELKKYDLTSGTLTQAKWNRASKYWENSAIKDKIRHYLSMTNPAQNSIGAARAGNNSSIDMLQQLYNGKYRHMYPSFTIAQYKQSVNSYIANPEETNFIQAAKNSKNDSAAYKKIRLTRKAFVYNKHGKLVKKGLHIKTLKRGSLVKALKNGKIVKIKGKRYYQIGKNEFIKVATY